VIKLYKFNGISVEYLPNLHIIPQTKKTTNVGLDVVERVNLF